MFKSLNLVRDPWVKLVDGSIVSLHDLFSAEEPPELAGTPIQRP